MFDHSRKISSIQDEDAKPMLWAPRAAVSGCRLSLDPTRAVPTTDQTGKSVIYVVPHLSDTIDCWSGEDWVPRKVPYDAGSTQSRGRLSITLSGAASPVPQDIYVRNVSGNWETFVQPWYGPTTRHFESMNGPDLTPDGLGLKDGRLCRVFQSGSKNSPGAPMPDWLYLGTYFMSGMATTEDSVAKRFLWNAYNQVSRPFKRMESTSTWTYGTSTWRQANASSANQVECVTGMTQFASTQVLVTAYDSGADSSVGIGVDSSTPHADCCLHYGSTNYGIGHFSALRHAALGYRTYRWCELRVSAGTVSFYGTTAYGGNNYSQCGMSGEVFA